MKQSLLIMLALGLSQILFAGGIVTNTNQSATHIRLLATDASTEIDAVYFNPAGLTFLPDGLSFSLNSQTIFQSRTIESNYQALNEKKYDGTVTVPVFPDVYLAYKTGKFAFSFGFMPVGGGGNAEYKKGLPSFEMPYSDLVKGLQAKGITDVTGYSSDIYFKGGSVYYGIQAGISFKINDMISVFGGARYVIAKNSYTGHLRDIQLNKGGTMVRADAVFNGLADQATAGAALATGAASSMQPIIDAGAGTFTIAQLVGAGQMTATQQAQLEGGLKSLGIDPTGLTAQQIQGAYQAAVPLLTASAMEAKAKASLLGDQEADVTQNGSGITPIIGVNLSLLDKKLNIGIKYELKTKLELENETTKDVVTGMLADGTKITKFPDGAKINSDIPALLSIGASYKFTDKIKVCAGFHNYWDKDVNWDGKEDKIDRGLYELAIGMEYQLSDKFLVSLGYLNGSTGVTSDYQSDMSYSLSSNTIGFGGKIMLSNSINLNLGMLYTSYTDGTKDYNYNFAGSGLMVPVNETYGKTNMVFAVGVDFQLFGKK